MKDYYFDIGNSNDGPIGMSANVLADSRLQAVLKLREALEQLTNPLEASDGLGVVHIRVWTNGNHVSTDDIFDVWEDE